MHEVMNMWSHREYEARKAWALDQWNMPSRTDYYLMQLAHILVSVNSSKPVNKKLDDYKIDFGNSQSKSWKEESVEERARRSKAFWAPLIAQAQVRMKDGDH